MTCVLMLHALRVSLVLGSSNSALWAMVSLAVFPSAPHTPWQARPDCHDFSFLVLWVKVAKATPRPYCVFLCAVCLDALEKSSRVRSGGCCGSFSLLTLPQRLIPAGQSNRVCVRIWAKSYCTAIASLSTRNTTLPTQPQRIPPRAGK